MSPSTRNYSEKCAQGNPAWGANDKASQARFVLEAEVTGGLNTPASFVYGLGHYADGRPYYAMRFIRGDNLTAPFGITRFDRSVKPLSSIPEKESSFRQLRVLL